MLITTTGEAYSSSAGQEVLRSSWNSVYTTANQ